MSTEYFSPKKAAPAYELAPLVSYRLAQSRVGEAIATFPSLVRTSVVQHAVMKGYAEHARAANEYMAWAQRLAPLDQGLTVREASSPSSSPIPPDWWAEALLRIGELLNLKAGWDTYDAQPIDRDTAQAALRFVWEQAPSIAVAPWIVPTPRGGLQFEWHAEAIDVELEFVPGAEPSLCVEDANDEYEGPFQGQEDLWARVLAQL